MSICVLDAGDGTLVKEDTHMLSRNILLSALLVFLFSILGLLASCGGSVNPALGARLVYEQELAPGLTGQIILQDMDLLEEDDEHEDDDYYYSPGY
jgi:hypothetical protein